MEENLEGVGENRLPAVVSPSESAALDIIRTETVLSRLPIHNLAKKGSISIQILKKTQTGEIELLWRVSPSRDYGEPRQLAYKLDTIIVNQRIDEAGRPLPKILRLGSLNDICAELGLAIDHGTNAKNLKNAFLQNALTGITAKFNYKGNDGSERRLEAGFTRYNVIFTGEKLPDGRKADAVYIIFNEPFWEVLNNAPVRPLDRAYMKELPPAAQRFYEIISRKIFAALKNHYREAKISYSEYCTFSAQLRHYERQRVQDQMAKVLRHHKESGYITRVKYEPTLDAENRPDWVMYFTPGPKAHDEFAIAHGRKPSKSINAGASEVGDCKPKPTRSELRSSIKSEVTPTAPTFDPQLIAEFTRRGIAEQQAIRLLANRKPGQDVIAQLELADDVIMNSRDPIPNPAGYRVRLIQRNIEIPDGFETSAKRKVREEQERKAREVRARDEAEQQLEWEYETYCERELDRYIEANRTAFEAIKDAKWKTGRERYSFMTESMAKIEARFEIRKEISLPTFEEFIEQKKQGTDFSLKLVAVSPAKESVPPMPEQEATMAEASIEAMPDAMIRSTENAELVKSEVPVQKEDSMRGPLIIELSSPPLPEIDEGDAEQGNL